MIEKYPNTTEDALLKVRNGINIKDYEKFKTLGYVDVKKLSQKQLDKLKALNLHLVEYEKEIKKQIVDLIVFSTKKVNDPDDWIEDFDGVEVVMSFYLAKDDPLYREYSDNLLMIMTNGFSNNMNIYGIDDGINHNEYRGWSEDKMLDGKAHPMCKDNHCWIFHGLYHHTQLQWEEILRIGSIDVDVKLRLAHNLRDVPK